MSCNQTSTGIAMLGCCGPSGQLVRTSVALNWYHQRFDAPSGPDAVAAMAAYLNSVDFSTDPIILPAVPNTPGFGNKFDGFAVADGQGFAFWYEVDDLPGAGPGLPFFGHPGNVGLAAYHMISGGPADGRRLSVAQKTRVRFDASSRNLITGSGYFSRNELFVPEGTRTGGPNEWLTYSSTTIESTDAQGIITSIIINAQTLPPVVSFAPFEESCWRGTFLS